MITSFDLFGEGRYQYTFRSRCDENPVLSMEDGAIRIFLNSHGKNSEEVPSELIEFLKYMESTDAALAENGANEKLKKIHKHVSQIKASEEMGVKYMQKWEEKVLDREEGRAEGRASESDDAKVESTGTATVVERDVTYEAAETALTVLPESVPLYTGEYEGYGIRTYAGFTQTVDGAADLHNLADVEQPIHYPSDFANYNIAHISNTLDNSSDNHIVMGYYSHGTGIQLFHRRVAGSGQ